MLFRCSFRERLEPVGDVCNVVLQSPLLHPCCNLVSCCAVEGVSSLDAVKQRLERVCVKVGMHLGTVKDKLSEVLGGSHLWTLCRNSLFLKAFLYEIRSVHRVYFFLDSSFFASSFV